MVFSEVLAARGPHGALERQISSSEGLWIPIVIGQSAALFIPIVPI